MLGFLCACVLIVSYLAAGIALSLLIDGIAPTFDLWNSETISFNGVALCTAMIYFEILPYVSTSFDNRVPTKGFPFNMRASPDAIALWTASILGTVQATVVLIMWRLLSVASGYYWPKVTWGVLTIAIMLFVFTLVAHVAENAKGLMHLGTVDQRKNQLRERRKKRNRGGRTKR